MSAHQCAFNVTNFAIVPTVARRDGAVKNLSPSNNRPTSLIIENPKDICSKQECPIPTKHISIIPFLIIVVGVGVDVGVGIVVVVVVWEMSQRGSA